MGASLWWRSRAVGRVSSQGSGMNTYYGNDRGRIVINFAYRNVRFFEMTRAVDLEEFETEPGLSWSSRPSRTECTFPLTRLASGDARPQSI